MPSERQRCTPFHSGANEIHAEEIVVCGDAGFCHLDGAAKMRAALRRTCSGSSG